MVLVRGPNPVIGQILCRRCCCCWIDENKEKEAGNGPFWQSYFKLTILGFLFIFLSFQTKKQLLKEIDVKNIHAGIWTHDLLYTSHHPQPLDQGSRPFLTSKLCPSEHLPVLVSERIWIKSGAFTLSSCCCCCCCCMLIKKSIIMKKTLLTLSDWFHIWSQIWPWPVSVWKQKDVLLYHLVVMSVPSSVTRGLD